MADAYKAFNKRFAVNELKKAYDNNDYKTQLTSLIQQIHDLGIENSGQAGLNTAQRMVTMLASLECYTDDWDSGAWKHDTAITLVEYATKLEDEIERDQ